MQIDADQVGTHSDEDCRDLGNVPNDIGRHMNFGNHGADHMGGSPIHRSPMRHCTAESFQAAFDTL